MRTALSPSISIRLLIKDMHDCLEKEIKNNQKKNRKQSKFNIFNYNKNS